MTRFLFPFLIFALKLLVDFYMYFFRFFNIQKIIFTLRKKAMPFNFLKLNYTGENNSIPFQYKLDINKLDLLENEISLKLDLEFQVPTDKDDFTDKIDLSLNISTDEDQNVKNNFNVKKSVLQKKTVYDDNISDNKSLKIELDNIIDELNKSIKNHTQNLKEIFTIDEIHSKKTLPDLDSNCNQHKVMRVYQNHLPTDPINNQYDKQEIKQEKMIRVYQNHLPADDKQEIKQEKMLRVYQNQLHTVSPVKDNHHNKQEIEKEKVLNQISRAYQDKKLIDLKLENTIKIEDDDNKNELDKKVKLIQEQISKSYKKRKYEPNESKVEITSPSHTQTFKNNRPKIFKEKSKNLVALLNNNDVTFQNIELAPIVDEKDLDNKLFYHLKLLLSVDDSINMSSNIIHIVTELMKFVDHFHLNGKDKKSMIIKTIHKYLLYSDNVVDNIDYLINTICPELIDILVSIDQRKIKIKQKMNCFVPWCS